jgi:hypothetical protein
MIFYIGYRLRWHLNAMFRIHIGLIRIRIQPKISMRIRSLILVKIELVF